MLARRTSLPHLFSGFVDSKGHSRFVLRISIFPVSRLTLTYPQAMTMELTAVGDTIASESTLSQNGQAMETDETHYFLRAQARHALGGGSRTPRNAVSAR